MNGHSEPPVIVPEGGLLRLVEAEARLTGAVAAAEQEARELVRKAHVAAAEQAVRVAVEIEAETAALATRVSAECEAEVCRILDAADERCRRLRDLPPDLIDDLAAEMERRLLSLPEARQ